MPALNRAETSLVSPSSLGWNDTSKTKYIVEFRMMKNIFQPFLPLSSSLIYIRRFSKLRPPLFRYPLLFSLSHEQVTVLSSIFLSKLQQSVHHTTSYTYITKQRLESVFLPPAYHSVYPLPRLLTGKGRN